MSQQDCNVMMAIVNVHKGPVLDLVFQTCKRADVNDKLRKGFKKISNLFTSRVIYAATTFKNASERVKLMGLRRMIKAWEDGAPIAKDISAINSLTHVWAESLEQIDRYGIVVSVEYCLLEIFAIIIFLNFFFKFFFILFYFIFIFFCFFYMFADYVCLFVCLYDCFIFLCILIFVVFVVIMSTISS